MVAPAALYAISENLEQLKRASTGEWTHYRYVFLGFLRKRSLNQKFAVLLYWEVQSKETRVQKRGREAGKEGE